MRRNVQLTPTPWVPILIHSMAAIDDRQALVCFSFCCATF
jgi:hypothetical protein